MRVACLPKDPDACLSRMLDALRDGDRHEVMEAMLDLSAWINNGGFLPKDPRIEPGIEAAQAAACHLRIAIHALTTAAETYEEAIRNRPTR